MSWNNCNLVLHSDSMVYAGDIVTGSLHLEFGTEQKVEYISMKVIGISKAQWTRPMATIPYIKIYSERKKEMRAIIDVFIELCGKTVSPGIYTHNFYFSLPNELPPSFKSSIASVKYCIKIKGKAKNKYAKKKIIPFEVNRKLDLSLFEEYLMPLEVRIHKTFSRNSEFSMYLKTHKTFSSKQTVPFEVTFQNENRVKISKIQVILIQKREYSISSGYANEEQTISKVEWKTFRNSPKEDCYFSMDIPQVISSTIDLENPMIDISYIFRVKVNFKFHLSLFEDVPVMVSTVPLLYYNYPCPAVSPA